MTIVAAALIAAGAADLAMEISLSRFVSALQTPMARVNIAAASTIAVLKFFNMIISPPISLVLAVALPHRNNYGSRCGERK
jgi:hypothetical protein